MGHREAASRYALKQSELKRDIGEIPQVGCPEERDVASQSLTSFCYMFQPGVFELPFADVHKEVIEILEQAINRGGLFAYAMPRGVGKTSIAEAACLWAVLTGKRRYVALISATEKHATQSLDNIKKELSTNEAILSGWPEIVYPCWCLENISHRAHGQTYQGNPTYLIWKGEQLVLPMIPGSVAGGSVIEVRGLTGAVRGMKANLPGGMGSIRPELVILDDPQTDESSKSPTQCKTRKDLILGAILGASGHATGISCVMPCTIIHKGDLAEGFTDREKHPEWNGIRTRLLVTMPSNMKLWEKYRDLRAEGLDVAHQFYLDNREDMDAGAQPIWKDCYNKENQASAIEHAMDLLFKVGREAFWAEYQNDPLDESSDGEMARVEDIIDKVTSYKRGQVPPSCQHLVMAIDVHKSALFYAICGWTEDFNGYVVDYGTWPETKRRYFSLGDITKTLLSEYPGRGIDGAIYAGLKDLTEKMIGKVWGSSRMRIEKCIIDANWKTQTVKTFCREAQNSVIIVPGHGRFIGASRKPLNEYRKATGDRVGTGWRIPGELSREGVRHVIYDTNFWKSFVNSAWVIPPGERGCLQLFSGVDHKLFSEHMTSEYFVKVEGRGRAVSEWNLHPGRDNHWFDCIVACAMAGGMLGCQFIDKPTERPRRKMQVRYVK